MSDRLLTCPYCGQGPDIKMWNEDGHAGDAEVWCANQECPVQPSAYGRTLDDAIDAWDTRAHSAPPARGGIRDAVASYAHDAWAGWMRYLFSLSRKNDDGSVTIPPELVERWERQMRTDYADLPSKEQRSDLDEADQIFHTIYSQLWRDHGVIGALDPDLDWLEQQAINAGRWNLREWIQKMRTRWDIFDEQEKSR